MTTQFLPRPEGRIAFDITGSGPLVICAPSLGDLRGEYRFLVPLLTAAGYQAASMDVRGHGESSTGWSDYTVAGVGSDLLALIEHLGGGPAVIIGTSMAAGAGVWAAAEAPERVAGLVMIGAAVRGETGPLANLLYGALFARPWGPAAWLKYYQTLYPTRKPADFRAYTAALQANLAEPGRLEALKQMIFASKRASEVRLPQVTAPALVLMGSKDPDFKDPEAEARWVAGQLHGTYEVIPEAGHYPQAEMPEVIGPKITAFLQSLKTWMSQPHAA